ncbi:MAG TPA: F0F1 ATP synthase subunit B [Acidimicrobiales bacterium]|nr:F0F1 ATP synthase subunit B [Acidimicrobiales bacterium]
MRNRLLLALGVLLLGLVGFTGHAFAQDEGGEVDAGEVETEEHQLSHEAEECIHILEDGGDVDECQEAPSPILPEKNEIIWGALSFLFVFAALAKFGFPAIKKSMEERTARIQADVDAAESAKAEVEAKRSEYDAKLAEARTEAARIIEEARQDADAYRSDKRAEADAEIARMKEQASADVEASKAQAIADIRGEVATLAIGAAETVVGQNLDRAANEALVEQFINSVGARGN